MSTQNHQAPSTTRARAEQKRESKLELVREQVESGSLVIRKMTDEERRQYPPRPVAPKPRRRWWAVGERERLISRIRQIRRVSKTADEASKTRTFDPIGNQLHLLETRVAHLESLVQGLQDSVHRESSRQAKRIAELEARIQPGALGKALSDDARARGL
jgi:hypothetical protein